MKRYLDRKIFAHRFGQAESSRQSVEFVRDVTTANDGLSRVVIFGTAYIVWPDDDNNVNWHVSQFLDGNIIDRLAEQIQRTPWLPKPESKKFITKIVDGKQVLEELN